MANGVQLHAIVVIMRNARRSMEVVSAPQDLGGKCAMRRAKMAHTDKDVTRNVRA